jgi:hypothetical protein
MQRATMNQATHTATSSAAFPHAVKFYDDEHSLGRAVAEFLAPGLHQRLPAIVIATPEHRTMIAEQLEQRGLDLSQLEHDGDLQMLDAEEVLARFMTGDRPDPDCFRATFDELMERAYTTRPPCPIRAYGEMVDVLWKRANAQGAIELEVLWNRVAARNDFSLLCGYAVGNFFKEVAGGPGLRAVCDQHTHVIGAEASA